MGERIGRRGLARDISEVAVEQPPAKPKRFTHLA
jgi:hypothetical protein